MITLVNQLWMLRNNIVHNGSPASPLKLMSQINQATSLNLVAFSTFIIHLIHNKVKFYYDRIFHKNVMYTHTLYK